MKNNMSINIKGLVSFRNIENPNEILFEIENDIHPENMAYVLARALSNDTTNNAVDFTIDSIRFGDGGLTHIEDGSGNIVYTKKQLNTNVQSTFAKLYNEKLKKSIKTDTTSDYAKSTPASYPSLASIVTISVTLAYDETLSYYNEIGLFSDNRMLTHVIFDAPMSKTTATANLIIYTLTVSVN